MKKITLLFLLLSQFGHAQLGPIQTVIKEIDFKSDTIESVFLWVTDNIRYDVKKLNKLKEKPDPKGQKQPGKSREERRLELISHALKYKKGVCEEYAAVFDALVKELGYEAFIVNGYTKKKNGNVNRSIGHAWNAVKVNGTWKLYDATWGAGYVVEGKRFEKAYKPEWYAVDPAEMIKRHMPFDPIWQLREPISYQVFDTNREIPTDTIKFNPENLIAAYLRQDAKSQMESQLKRSQEMGDGISLLKRWRKNITKNINRYGINSKVDDLNAANDRFAKGVKLFNVFITAQKKQFKGKKYSLSVTKTNLEAAKVEVQSALEVYHSVEVEDRKGKKMVEDAIKGSNKLISEIDRALAYLARQ